MSTPARVSPLTDAQMTDAARWIELEQMRVVAAFRQEHIASLQTVAIGDLSFRRRTGVKGPGAAAALNAAGITTPQQPNQWCMSEGA
ncbi:MAG: methylglutamate dehydrogenase, partial [Oxalobacteraceae bacterium]|nr:methylglutamate dehydrogenase [Oxalobacteraceae bacterium]